MQTTGSVRTELEHVRALWLIQQNDIRQLKKQRDELAARLSLSEASLSGALEQLDALQVQMQLMHQHYVKQLDSKFEDRMGIPLVEPQGEAKKWEPN